MSDGAAGITPESCAQGRFVMRPCAPQLLRHLGRRSIGACGVGGHASLSCPASHDGRFVYFEKVCAADFRPSTIVAHSNNESARPHAVTLAWIASAADWSSSLVSGAPDRCDPATGRDPSHTIGPVLLGLIAQLSHAALPALGITTALVTGSGLWIALVVAGSGGMGS